MASDMLTAGVALVLTSALVSPVMALLRRLQLVDVPNERSSHTRATLRGGGIAPASVALVALAVSLDLPGQTRLALLVAGGCFGMIGLIEDVRGLRVSVRLVLQAFAALAVLPFALSGLGAPGAWALAAGVVAFAWIVSYVNAFNFMDGIDGMSVAQLVVAGTAWTVIGLDQDVRVLVAPSLIIIAVALGFAPFNFPRARVFLGDVGSYSLGALLAALAVVGLRAGIPPEAVLAPLALVLADTGSTLVWRAWRREPLYLPHCDHVYQRLVRLGWTHARTTLIVMVLMVACAALGSLSLVPSGAGRVAGDVGLVVLLGGYLALPGWVGRRSRTEAGVRTVGVVS